MTALGSPSVSNCSPEAHWKPGPWGPTLSLSVVSVLKLSFKWYHIFTWVNFGKWIGEQSLCWSTVFCPELEHVLAFIMRCYSIKTCLYSLMGLNKLKDYLKEVWTLACVVCTCDSGSQLIWLQLQCQVSKVIVQIRTQRYSCLMWVLHTLNRLHANLRIIIMEQSLLVWLILFSAIERTFKEPY